MNGHPLDVTELNDRQLTALSSLITSAVRDAIKLANEDERDRERNIRARDQRNSERFFGRTK